VNRLLEELRDELRARRYRPRPVRLVFIPKPDGPQRPSGILVFGIESFRRR